MRLFSPMEFYSQLIKNPNQKLCPKLVQWFERAINILLKYESIIGISYCYKRASRRIHLGLTTASTLISAIQALIWWSRNLISMVDDDLLSMVQDKSFCVRRRICCLGSKAILVSMEEKEYRIYGGRRISCQWSGNQSRISRSSGELEWKMDCRKPFVLVCWFPPTLIFCGYYCWGVKWSNLTTNRCLLYPLYLS